MKKIYFANRAFSNIKRKAIDRLDVQLRHVPSNLNSLKITCTECKYLFSPDWLEKHKQPNIPVKPLNSTPNYPGRWILSKISQTCPKCHTSNILYIPVKKARTKGALFGDEAYRSYFNKSVFVYSLIGADQTLIPILNTKLNRLKEV